MNTTRLPLSLIFWSAMVPAFLFSTSAAQHTQVEKNGAGRIETDYNAENKIVAMRTIDGGGNLQQKVAYEYLPGYYAAQQTDTTYWPNGKLRRVVHKSYDAGTNYTGELLQLFDEAGKQVAGHKLSRDPLTGIYRCAEWDASRKNYRGVECPSGEDESGGPGPSKKFSYEGVKANLEAARNASIYMPEAAEVHGQIAIVLPASIRPGERISGAVTTNPEEYSDNPELNRTVMTVPGAFGPSRLSDWVVEVPGEKPQAADHAVTFVVPSGGNLQITLRRRDNPGHAISATIDISAAKERNSRKAFQSPPLCFRGSVCTVTGPFSGGSAKTFVAFEKQPARIVAETNSNAYIEVPASIEAGSHPLYITEGSNVIALPVIIADFSIANQHADLKAGEHAILTPTLTGPESLPKTAWRAGIFPETNLSLARRLVPGFKLAKHESKKDQESEPKERKEEGDQDGEILLVIKNLTPTETSMRGATNETLVFHLSAESFDHGEFKYNLALEAAKAAAINLKTFAIPFLAPVTGQVFTVNSAAQ